MIIPGRKPSQELSIALRIVHDLQVYHRLDAEIFAESEATLLLRGSLWLKSNIVFIGSPSSDFASDILKGGKTPFEIKDSRLILNGQAASGTDIGTFGNNLPPLADAIDIW